MKEETECKIILILLAILAFIAGLAGAMAGLEMRGK